MAYLVMAYVVVAYVGMAYVVMAWAIWIGVGLLKYILTPYVGI